MITDGEKWHYLDAESLSRLLHGITSEYNDHNYINCLHSFRTKSKLESHEIVSKNHDCSNNNAGGMQKNT